ncbi:hypothetical protein WH50_19290 [Pokkaliibacter plantistimulans]|uniref:Uncharacterized protein n=1 Tax=Pokkaliibacter plantistimulans TaxID=1635171 RepID=A0ABX5LSR5_9GAMM|nr:hypothetical protein [Pokkaliibacter plantistimulans]PXF29689.1 hypothetical protein WH50_19290 [Pokkaliibacter plantistimulans]
MSYETSCSKPAYIIEILGKDHPTTQQLKVESKGQPTRVEVREGGQTLGTSTLHTWEENVGAAAPPLTTWIEITGGESTLRLPLFDGLTDEYDSLKIDKLRVSACRGGRQDYVVAPIIPLVQGEQFGTPLASRPGFLYVFRERRLWRELRITQADDGSLRFQDSDVLAARGGTVTAPLSTSARRNFVGALLEEVWLPLCVRNTQLPVALFYSELQLTAERINFLEAQRTAYYEHTLDFTQLAPVRCSDSLSHEPSYVYTALPQQPCYTHYRPGSLFWVDDLPAQRPRHIEQEWLSAVPEVYLTDLSGKAPQQEWHRAYNIIHQRYSLDQTDSATELATSCDALANATLMYINVQFGSRAGANRYNNPSLGGHKGKGKALTVPALPPLPVLSGPPPQWQPQPAVTDCLQAVKQRHICGFVLPDPFALQRQANAQMQHAHAYLNLLQELACRQPHYPMAELTNRLVMAKHFAKTADDGSTQRFANPWHDSYAEMVDTTPRAPLARLLFSTLREVAREALGRAQQHAASLLGSGLMKAHLPDYFSKNGSDYLGAFYFVSTTLQLLAGNPARIDPLNAPHVPGADVLSEPARALYKSFSDYSGDWLAQMLFPAEGSVPLARPFTRADVPAPEDNPGDGRCRPGYLAWLVTGFKGPARFTQYDGQMPSDDPLQSLDMALLEVLATLSESGQEDDQREQQQHPPAQQQGQPTETRGGSDGISANTKAQTKRIANDIDAIFGGIFGILPGITGSSMTRVEVEVSGNALRNLLALGKLIDTPLVRDLYLLEAEALTGYPQARVIGIDYAQPAPSALPLPNQGTTHAARTVTARSVRWYEGNTPLPNLNLEPEDVRVSGPSRRIALVVTNNGSEADTLLQRRALEDNWLAKGASELLGNKFVSPLISVFLLSIELWNVKNEWANKNIQRLTRSIASIGSATYDLVGVSLRIAMDIERFRGQVKPVTLFMDHALITGAEQASTLRQQVFGRLLGKVFGEYLIPNYLTRAMLFNTVGFILTSAVAVMDTLERWSAGDKATAAAMAGLAIGTGLIGIAFYHSLLVLGIVGALIGATALLISFYTYKDDTALLLRDGPLSRSPNTPLYGHLLDNPPEASYRLLNQLAGFSITVEPNPYVDKGVYYYGDSAIPSAADYDAVRHKLPLLGECNWRVRVESALASLLAAASYRSYFQLQSTSGWLGKNQPIYPRYSEITDSGRCYYFRLPTFNTPLHKLKAGDVVFVRPTIISRIQLTVWDDLGGMSVFPAPPPRDPTRFDPQRHLRPHMDKTGQPFSPPSSQKGWPVLSM